VGVVGFEGSTSSNTNGWLNQVVHARSRCGYLIGRPYLLRVTQVDLFRLKSGHE
jgi:hypothetical protein